MNWKFWKKKETKAEIPKVEDITQKRNLAETLASIPVGCGFMIQTRDGFKEFKCIGMRAYPEKKK